MEKLNTRKRNIDELDREEIANKTNELINWAVTNYKNRIEIIPPTTPQTENKSKAQLAFEKFISKPETNNQSINSNSDFNSALDENSFLKVTNNKTTCELLNKIRILEKKVITTEILWKTALKQVDTLKTSINTVVKTKTPPIIEEKKLLPLPPLPISNTEEFAELEAVLISNDKAAVELKNRFESNANIGVDPVKFVRSNIRAVFSDAFSAMCVWSDVNAEMKNLQELKKSKVMELLLTSAKSNFSSVSYKNLLRILCKFLAECSVANDLMDDFEDIDEIKLTNHLDNSANSLNQSNNSATSEISRTSTSEISRKDINLNTTKATVEGGEEHDDIEIEWLEDD